MLNIGGFNQRELFQTMGVSRLGSWISLRPTAIISTMIRRHYVGKHVYIEFDISMETQTIDRFGQSSEILKINVWNGRHNNIRGCENHTCSNVPSH